MGHVKNRLLGVIFVLFIFSSTFIVLSILNFYRVLQVKEAAMQEETLSDMSQFTSNFMDVKLEGYLSTLQGLADLFAIRNESWESVRERLNVILGRQEFQHIGLSSLDGMIWATDGTKDLFIDITGRPYWSDLMAGKAVISDAKDSLVADYRIFVVAVPIISRTGQVVGVVHGAIALDEFQNYEASRFEIGTYLVFVVDRSGSFILRDHKHPGSWDYSTIFEELDQSGEQESSAAIARQLQEGGTFQTETTILGNDYMLCFSPLSLNDWYTVVLMPKDEVNNHIEVLLDDNINVLMVCVIVPLVLICVVFFLFMRREIKSARNKEFRLREKLFADIDGFIQADLDGDKIAYCSRSLNLPNESMPFSHLMEVYIREKVDEDYREKLSRILSLDNLLEIFAQGIARISQEYRAKDKKDVCRWFQCDIHMERVDDHVALYFIVRNIDEKKRMEAALKTKAERDALTGLYNRSAATDLINVFLHLNTHDSNVTHAFVILDLDNFKTLNDTLLHKTGDKALQDVAHILVNYFRREDVVCRLGGDEFVVFLKNITYEQLESKFSSLMNDLHLTYSKDDKSVTISASAGVALAPVDGTVFRELYSAADQALYQAKKEGKATFRRFIAPQS